SLKTDLELSPFMDPYSGNQNKFCHALRTGADRRRPMAGGREDSVDSRCVQYAGCFQEHRGRGLRSAGGARQTGGATGVRLLRAATRAQIGAAEGAIRGASRGPCVAVARAASTSVRGARGGGAPAARLGWAH